MYYTLVPLTGFEEKEFYALPLDEQSQSIADAYSDKLDEIAAEIGITYKQAKDCGVHPLDNAFDWWQGINDEFAYYKNN